MGGIRFSDIQHPDDFNLYDDEMFNTNLFGNPLDDNTPDYLNHFSNTDFSGDLKLSRAGESGDIGDFLYGGVAGLTSGLTFGLVRIGPDEDQQTMAYRMGAGLGDVTSLVLPMGPFGLLGKASRRGMSALSRGSRTIAKKASSETAQTFAKKGVNEKFLKNTLDDALLKDDTTKSYLMRHGISDEELLQANKLLETNVVASIKAAFKKGGRKIDDRIAQEVGEKAAAEIRRGGRHINTIEDWIENAVGAKLGPGVSKYIGMAAQDMYLFTAHNLIVQGVGKLVHDDPITAKDVGHGFIHSAAMSLAFPLIRKLDPFGPSGDVSLKQGAQLFRSKKGIKGFSNQYNRTNYRDMVSTKEGEQTARGLLGQMTRGAEMNAQNVSLFKGQIYKIKDSKGVIHEYGPEKILTSLGNPKAMPGEHVSLLLEEYRKIADKAFREWGWAYMKDMGKSLPRMIVGSLVMNSEAIYRGDFKYTPGPEAFQHLAIGAMMTKSRGLWGRNDVTQWSKKFKNYHNTYAMLNMEHNKLSEMVKVWDDNRRIGEMYGLTNRTTKAGGDIFKIFWGDETKNSQIHTDVSDGKVSQAKFEKVNQFAQLANSMKVGDHPDHSTFKPIDVKRLSKQRIDELYSEINRVTFPDGSPVSEMNLGDVLSLTEIEVGKNVGNFYYSYLDEVSRETGLPIVVEKTPKGEYTGNIEVFPIQLSAGKSYSADGKYEHSVNRLVELLGHLEGYGIVNRQGNKEYAVNVDVVTSKEGKQVVIKGQEGKDIGPIVEQLTERYMSHVVRGVHGNNDAHRFNFLGTRAEDNPYLNAILSGRVAEARETAFRLANGKEIADPRFKDQAINFNLMADKVFKFNTDVEGIRSGDARIGTLFSRPPKVIVEKNADKPEIAERISKAQDSVNRIYDWYKAGYTGDVNHTKKRTEISLELAEQFLATEKSLKLRPPQALDYGIGGFNLDLADYVARRTLEEIGFNEEALSIAVAARDVGLFTLENKTILTPEALKTSLLNRNDMTPKEINDLVNNKYRYIFERLNAHPKIQSTSDLVIGGDPFLIGSREINDIYNVTLKGMVPKIKKSLEESIESIKGSTKGRDITELGVELNKKIGDLNTYIESIDKDPRFFDVNKQQTVQGVLKEFQGSISNIFDNIKNKVGGSSALENSLRNMVAETNQLITLYSESTGLAGGNKYNPETLMTIGEAITDIVELENFSSRILNTELARLSSLGNSPIGKGQLISAESQIMKKISIELGRPDALTTMTLKEAILEYVNNRSFESLNRIVTMVNENISRELNFNYAERENSEIKYLLDEIKQAQTAHANNSTPIKIIKRYGLQDPSDVNKIDPRFVELVTEAVQNPTIQNDIAVEQYIRRRVVEKHGTSNERDKLVSEDMRAFRIEYPVLIKQLGSASGLKTEYYINNDNLEYDNAVPGKRTLAGATSKFVESFGFEEVGVLSDVVIINNRKTDLSTLNKKQINNLVNKNVLTSKNLATKLQQQGPDTDLLSDVIHSNKSLIGSVEKVVIDFSAGNPIVLPLTDANLNVVHKKFNQWVEFKLTKLGGQTKDNFETSIKTLREHSGISSIDAKMVMMHVDQINTGGFNKMFEQNVFRQASRLELNKLQEKLLKISKQSVNENYSRVSMEWLEHLTRTRGLDSDVKTAVEFFKEKDVTIQVVSDEAAGQLKDNKMYPTNNYEVIRKQYQKIINNKDGKYHPDEIAAAKQSLKELGVNESVLSSLIDGNVTILDHGFTILNGALQGDSHSNGFKNNISYNTDVFGTDSRGIITKGYFHENPIITQNKAIKTGATLLMGESSAKSLYGLDVNGKTIEPYKLDPNKSLMENLKDITPDSGGKITIPFESIGFGYSAKTGEKGLATHSLADFAGKVNSAILMEYQGIKNNLKLLSKIKDNFHKFHDEQQALLLFEKAIDETGLDFTDGTYSSAQMLLQAGLSHHNPVIKNNVMSLFRSQVFNLLRRPMVENAAESYVVPDFNGNHMSPTFRTVKKTIEKSDGTGNRFTDIDIFRVQNTFGHQSAPAHLGNKAIFSMDQVNFVFKINGRDIVVRATGDKKKPLEFIDHLTDVLEANKGSFVGANERPAKISDANKKEITSLLQGVEQIMFGNVPGKQMRDVNYNSLLRFLQTGKTLAIGQGTGDAPITLDISKLKPILEKYDVGIGTNTIAIPKKSYDVGFHRIKSFLNKEWGNHTIVNAHDLRTMHQRDGDGDRLSMFLDLPRQIVRDNIQKSGVITDYRQMPRVPHEANIFGFNKQGEAGSIHEDVGFTGLKNKVFSGKFGIGETIISKNIINFMNKIGLQFHHRDKTVSLVDRLDNINGIDQNMTSRAFQVLTQQADLFQNKVDYFGGKLPIDKTRDYIFFGELQNDIANSLGINPKGVITEQAKFHSQAPGQKSGPAARNLKKDIVYEIMRTIKRGMGVFNDPFNEGGQQPVTDYYIKKAHNDLTSMLRDPNTYIVERMFSKYKNDSGMQHEILQLFYREYRSLEPVQDQSNIQMFMKDIFRGKIQKPTYKFVQFSEGIFEGNRYTNVTDLMNRDATGVLLDGIARRGILRDKDYYGEILEANKDIQLSDIIGRTGNLLHRVSLYRSYFPSIEPSTRIDKAYENEADFFDARIPIKDPGKKTMSWKNKEMRSVAYHLLNKDASRLQVELAKMEGSPFKVNEYDKEILDTELANIKSTLFVLEKMAMKDLVDKNQKAKVVTRTKFGDVVSKHRTGKIHVYRIFGEHLNADAISKADYNQLEYAGTYSKGDTKFYQKGYTYVEVQKPLIRQYIGDNQSLHALSLYEAIYKTTNIDMIIPNKNKQSEFYEDLAVLTTKISQNFAFTKNVLQDPKQIAQKTGAFQFASEKDQALMEEFMFKWVKDNGKQKNEDVISDRTADIIKLIIQPRPASGQYVEVANQHLPYLYMSNNLQKASFQYLKNEGLIVAESDGTASMPEKLKVIYDYQKNRVKEMQGIKPEDAAYDRMLDHHQAAISANSGKSFEVLGEASSSVQYLMSDYGYVDPGVGNILKDYSFNGQIYSVDKTSAKGHKSKVIFKKTKKRKDNGC